MEPGWTFLPASSIYAILQTPVLYLTCRLTGSYFLFSLSEKQLLTVYHKTLYYSFKKTKRNKERKGFVGHLSTSFASLTVNSPVIQCIILSASRRAPTKSFYFDVLVWGELPHPSIMTGRWLHAAWNHPCCSGHGGGRRDEHTEGERWALRCNYALQGLIMSTTLCWLHSNYSSHGN